MGDPGRAEAAEEGIDTLPCCAELKRAPAAERAQKDLQAAIAADVIEGRPLLQWRFRDRGRQRAQSVRDELGRAARAGCRQDPFGFPARGAGRVEPLQAAIGRARQIRSGAAAPRPRRHGRAHQPPRRARPFPVVTGAIPADTDTIRRAQPSRSISAAAALAMSPTHRTTERFRSCARCGPRLEAHAKSSSGNTWSRVATTRPRPPALSMRCVRFSVSSTGFIVKGDKIGDCADVVRFAAETKWTATPARQRETPGRKRK